MFVLICLYLTKALFLKGENAKLKLVMVLSLVGVAVAAESYMDADVSNHGYILAIPVSTLLLSQALIDWQRAMFTKDQKVRTFYFLDSSLKSGAVHGNLLATVIFSGLLIKWLYVIETNNEGLETDALHLKFIIGVFIFYFIFMVERIGSFVLDTLHE